LALRGVHIGHLDIQVTLLRAARVRPLRRAVVSRALEREDQSGGGMHRHKVSAHGPPAVALINCAAQHGSVEGSQLTWVRAVEHDALHDAEGTAPRLLAAGHRAR